MTVKGYSERYELSSGESRSTGLSRKKPRIMGFCNSITRKIEKLPMVSL
jgi:hypothetical protein